MDIYERQLLFRCPRLATMLQTREFLAPFYSIEWFTTAWVLACPPALTLAIYDLLLFGFKVGVYKRVCSGACDLIFALLFVGCFPALCSGDYGSARSSAYCHEL